MATVGDILLNKHTYNLDDMTSSVIKTYSIPNTHHNNVFIKQKLKDVIEAHGLSTNDSMIFNEIQNGTFVREMKAIIDKHNWANLAHNSNTEYKIKHLGNNLSRRYYSEQDIVNYIINEIDLPVDEQTINPIKKQVARICNAYKIYNDRISTGLAYSIIDAMKQFLHNHNDVKIKPLRKYSFGDVIMQLIKDNHISHLADFRLDFIAENQRRFKRQQKDRYMSGTKDHPSYFTADEVKKLGRWAHYYALTNKSVKTKDLQDNVKTNTKDIVKNTTQQKAKENDQSKHQYHTIPLDSNVNIDKLYSKEDIENYLIKANNLLKTTSIEKRLGSKIDRLVRKAIASGSIKEYPYKSVNCYHRCYYTQNMLNYITNHIDLSTESRNITVTSTDNIDLKIDSIKDEKSNEDDMSISDVTTESSNVIPNNTIMNNSESIPQSEPWQTEDTSILIANPFSIDDQIKVLTKRFLLDQYKIDLQSWKADQEALKALDYRSEAYANLYMRLLHPEINYVTKK